MQPDQIRARQLVSVGPAARALVAGLRSGELGVLAEEARRRFRSDWLHYGLSRDLDQPFEAPTAKFDLTIRPLRSTDVPKLLDMRSTQMAPAGRMCACTACASCGTASAPASWPHERRMTSRVTCSG